MINGYMDIKGFGLNIGEKHFPKNFLLPNSGQVDKSYGLF